MTSLFDLDTTRWDLWADRGLPTGIDAALAARGTHSTAAIATVAALAAELESRLEHLRPPAAVDRFLAAGEAWEDRLDRWSTLRTLERLAHLPAKPLPWPGWAPPDPNLRRRPLTSVEIGLVRLSALRTKAKAALVGALDAGLASGELPLVAADQIVVADGAPAAMRAPGTCRDNRSGYPEAFARRLDIHSWCRPAFTAAVEHQAAGPRLLYQGNSATHATIQSAQLMAVGTVLADAGLAGDPTVKPLSIRNTAGRHAYETAGRSIEAAADLLGHDDLMFVAREIGIRPHRPTRR